MQKSREEHARSAAQKAADELSASLRERERDQAHEAAPVSPRGGGSGGGGGILSSVQESARSVMGKAAEAKEKAAAAMESAKEYAVDVKEGARRALAGDAVRRKGETEESAWQQGLDVRRRAAERAREEAERGRREPSEEEKGRAATENIFGAAADRMGAFRDKMVMPTDVVDEKRAEVAGHGRSNGGEAAARPTAGTGDDDEDEDVMLRVKAADQMTGQMFNDVGKMGEEGTGMPRRRR